MYMRDEEADIEAALDEAAEALGNAEEAQGGETPAEAHAEAADAPQGEESASDGGSQGDAPLFAPKTPYEKAIAAYLEREASPELREKILAAREAGFGIAECYAYIVECARKQADGGSCAMIADDVVYGWAVHYFEDEWQAERERKAKEAAAAEKRKAEWKANAEKRKAEAERKRIEAEKSEEERLASMTAEERKAYEDAKARREAEEAERQAAKERAEAAAKAKREEAEAKRKEREAKKRRAKELEDAQMWLFSNN